MLDPSPAVMVSDNAKACRTFIAISAIRSRQIGPSEKPPRCSAPARQTTMTANCPNTPPDAPINTP